MQGLCLWGMTIGGATEKALRSQLQLGGLFAKPTPGDHLGLELLTGEYKKEVGGKVVQLSYGSGRVRISLTGERPLDL